MPTLSQFSLSRLFLLRRVPFWAQALALCALFAVVGVAVLDDYGIGRDEFHSHRFALINFDYVTTGDISGISQYPDITYRHNGVAFEMPLLLTARALGLQDTRDIFIARHLLTHLFFIAGGFACGMLVYRTLGSKWVALLAMLMFLLHPRLYTHSFFNSKDIPFAAMLMVALYLAHRAFRRDTFGAFLLCGIGVGLAINLRVFALMLPPMILAMRGLDLWQAGRVERKRILASAGIFAGAALATVYISYPYYWENPLRFIEGILVFAQHPSILIDMLFMGELYRSDTVPWNFIPVWFGITAPPIALLLGVIGCAAVCWQATTRPIAALRDREIRFRIMPLGCFALPVAVVIILQSNIYDGWRQMYFLWGPFCLLAAVGLHVIANSNVGRGGLKVAARLPDWARGGRWRMARRALAYGVAGFGVITTLTAMVALHPYEYVYFNALTDTKTPGELADRYDMDHWWMARWQLLKRLLARYPDDDLRVWPAIRSALLLPEKDRNRLIGFGNSPSVDFYRGIDLLANVGEKNVHAADFYLMDDARGRRILRRNIPHFYLHPRVNAHDIPERPPIDGVRAYGSVVTYIVAKDVDAYRAAYDDIAANGDLLARADFDIYIQNDALYYLNADCAPRLANADARIFLHIFPAAAADLPADSRELGFENLDFRLIGHNLAFFDGKCIYKQPLPDYPVARIRTGQNAADGEGGVKAIWHADINLAARVAIQAVYERIAAGDYGAPAAQSRFDLYLRDNTLAYIKEPCAAGDTDARFFLHIIPTNPADLPMGRREAGFEKMDFQFMEHGAYAGYSCVAKRELPDYPIERIRTGQFVIGGDRLWIVEFPVGR